ncbi:MAG: flavin reductase family protein [Pseudomonadota bacterium]
MPFDPQTAEDLKRALRRLAKAVVVISLEDDGQRFAMAATAVSEVSLDPPSMLACVHSEASIAPSLERRRPFCLNILDASQEDISRRCSAAPQGAPRFEIGDWQAGEQDVPYLADAQANIFCNNDMSVRYGTHDIIVGQVTHALARGTVDPLLYADGRYGRFID